MEEHPTEALRERGVRITPQRARIWEYLAGSGRHLTAEEIWERVNGVLPGLELSTVYRALEALGKAGLVVDSRLPEGPRVFEARPVLHPHLVCESCGGIFHPNPEVSRRVFEALNAGSEGFEIHELHVVAKGVCTGCARR
jgi:Fur family peroxide stress response transcriptional regulator